MPLKFAYTIIYVPNVTTSIEFFENAFGLQRRFIADGNDYAELKRKARNIKPKK